MITAGARHVGGGDGSDVCVFVDVGLSCSSYLQGGGFSCRYKEGVSRAGGQCAEKGRTQSKPGRGSREVHAIL